MVQQMTAYRTFKSRFSRRLVIAGGGTGGHLFPGIALAQAFVDRSPANRVLFVSSGNSFEVRTLAQKGFALNAIAVEGIKGRGRRRQIGAAAKIPRGVLQAARILHRFAPHAVLGVGSYAAGPVVAAAWLLRIPVVIHEQNRIPGITNRWLAPMATRIHVSFEATAGGFPGTKVRISGNPIRRELQQLAQRRRKRKTAPSKEAVFTVLILGGSQGAHAVNTAVAEALAHLPPHRRWFFIHQTGLRDATTVQQAYRQNGICGDVRAFFDDMAAVYDRADLIVCRAGATTVAEIAAVGKAAVFIPFPFAADDHQRWNALALVEKDAAEMIVQTALNGRRLAERIEFYASHPAIREAMAERAAAFGRPNAAAAIVADLYRQMRPLRPECLKGI